MAFRPIYSFKRGREYIVGEGTERIAYDNMVKASKEIEKKNLDQKEIREETYKRVLLKK